ncbi:alpha/beta hydrolase [Muricoccus aerilatus]|uniref:alpha/beta hydrolase n=1 Tax=Muricoccus aerilatus TaxID=452982 RepID=UPI0005C143EA|nr:alpha/beta hydrolase [Roseomonas aerilata]
MLRRLAPAALAISLTIAAPPSPARAAEVVAARIAYEEVARPAGLPETFQPAEAATLRFLVITAIDGNRVDAALWEPRNRPPAETTLVVAVHGSGDNFAHAPADALGRGLSAGGRAVLSISTRQHDDRVNTENFFDVRRDIEAAVMTARSLGYGRLVLSGHSLGNIQVQFYAATDWSSDIRGVVLLGPFANLPWKTRNILMQDEPAYRRLNEAARAMLRDGRLAERLPEPMGFYTGQRVPVTAQHFLTYRSDAVSAADGTFWIRRIPKPVLIMRDAADAVIQPFEPHMLLSAANAEGSLTQGARYVLLPNDRPPSLAGHYFPDTADKLVETLGAWLAERQL